jgi:transposase-like protein
MAIESVRCPHCQSGAVVKYGTTATGKERFRCQPENGCGRTFIREYTYSGRLPQVKRQIVEMTLNGSGVRAIARVLQSSPTTGIEELKKRPQLSSPLTRRWSEGALPRRSR